MTRLTAEPDPSGPIRFPTPQLLVLMRTVDEREQPWMKDGHPRRLIAGSLVWLYRGPTYGCISPKGIAVSFMPHKGPYFELPLDALQAVVHIE